AAAVASPARAAVRIPGPGLAAVRKLPSASSAACGTCAGAWRTTSPNRLAAAAHRLRCRIQRPAAAADHTLGLVEAARNFGPAVAARPHPAAAADHIRPGAAALP